MFPQTLSNLQTSIAQMNEIIDLLQMQEEIGDLTVHESNLRDLSRGHMLDLLESQNVYRMQRDKIIWVKLGDANTKFFHANVAVRHRHNLIASLKNDNQMGIYSRP